MRYSKEFRFFLLLASGKSEKLNINQFANIYTNEKNNIKHVKFLSPTIGEDGFGKFEIEFKKLSLNP